MSKLQPVQVIDALRALAREAHRQSVDAGNYRANLSASDQILHLYRYLGTAANYVRRSKPLGELTTDKTGKPIGFPALMANLQLTLLDMCERHGVDLGAATVARMEWNRRQLKRTAQ